MRKQAFTLIELLVVIMILAIIAVLVITKLANSQQNARNGQAQTSVTQMAKGVEVFKNDISNISGKVIRAYRSSNDGPTVMTVRSMQLLGSTNCTNNASPTFNSVTGMCAVFSGTLDVVNFTYGTDIDKSQNSQYSYQYGTNGGGITKTYANSGNYYVGTNLVGASNAYFWVKNNQQDSGSAYPTTLP